MNINEFKKLPVLGILRGVKEHMIAPLTEAVIKAGLKSIEITMNTEDAPNLIKMMIRESQGKLTVGAGTVLSMSDLELAINVGASFIVMPVLIEEVMEYCTKNNISVFPGAFTPSEIFKAWRMGASMVKVFPVKSVGGPEYIREIKGPLNDIDLLACAGVTRDNCSEYFRKGASAISFGGDIFNLNEMENANYINIENDIRQLIEITLNSIIVH